MIGPLLLGITKFVSYAKGGEYLLQGVEAVTGVPAHSSAKAFVKRAVDDTKHTVHAVAGPVVSGRAFRAPYGAARSVVDTVARPIMAGAEALVGDARQIVSGATRVVAGVVGGRDYVRTGEGELPVEKTSANALDERRMRAEATKALVAAEAKRNAAARKAVDIRSRATKERDPAKASELENRARATDRLIAVSARSAERAEVALGGAEVEDGANYAQFSLNAALAAQAPPADAHDVLASDKVSDEEKERYATFVDDVNRVQEPDIDALVDLGVGNSVSDVVAGHDHGHGSCETHTCGKPCCGGATTWGGWEDPGAQAAQGFGDGWVDEAPSQPVAGADPFEGLDVDPTGGGDDFDENDNFGGGCSTGTCSRKPPPASW